MIVFKTGADGDSAGTPTEKFRIESSGSCGIVADGSTTTNHLRLGVSADLKIYHDGSNSYVDDTGDGALILNGSEVKLSHAGSAKVTTSSSGVTVTGALTASGDSYSFFR